MLLNNYQILLEQSEIEFKYKNYQNQKPFQLMTYVEETSYFEIVPPGHTITYKNVYTYVRFCLITLILLIINNVNALFVGRYDLS